MVGNLSVVIPFFNGHQYIDRLINSIPKEIPIIIVDDRSDEPLINRWGGTRIVTVVRLTFKGYFAGACNVGFDMCDTDVLVLNQDTWFDNDWAFGLIDDRRNEGFAFLGERIKGIHPSFGELGYIHGTFAWFRRDAINRVGYLNFERYPLWGSTAEWQWRAARAGFMVLPLKEIPGFHHERPESSRYGSSIAQLLEQEKEKKNLLIRTPPILSVVVLCYNYGRYIQDCINSLIGGSTSLGEMAGQTIRSFEIVIVDDASTDNSWELIQNVTSIEKGIRSFRLAKNVGTAKALNYGIDKAVGKYITFLSADDMRESESLEKLVEICEQNPHSFAYDDIWLFYKNQRLKKWPMEDYDFEKLLYKNHIHAGIVFPKAAWEEVGGYPAIMNDGREDWAFNVSLGIKGWCGIHLKEYGYLYRREGQNRTERNTTPEHRQRFLGKIASLFPDIYEGHRPMACCGGGKNKQATSNGKVSALSLGGMARMANTVGTQGMVKIEYLGKKMSFTLSGDTTNADYTFGSDGRTKAWVDKRDVGSRDGKNGFLSKKDPSTGQWLFKLADKESIPAASLVEEVAVEMTVAEPIAQEQPVEEVSGLGGFSNVSASLSAPTRSLVVTFPNPIDMNVEEIKRLSLTKEQWEEVYKSEMANRHRAGAIKFIEEKLSTWES